MIFRHKKISFDQFDAMIIAMHVRNEMEDFHVAHLTDAQMKELNPIIRRAIYEGLLITRRATKELLQPGEIKDGKKYSAIFRFLEMMIPDYWEVPTEYSLKKNLAKMEDKK